MTFEIGSEKGEEEIQSEVEAAIAENEVVLFMKGSELMPQCGYSRTALELLQRYREDVYVVNVLDGPLEAYREVLQEFSEWETIPQVFVEGEFVGGADILKELDDRGELAETLGEEPTEAPF